MTYMPEFLPSATETSHEYQAKAEAQYLVARSRQKLTTLFHVLDLAAPESVYQARLDAELKILADKGYCGYFLIVADYVAWARNNGIAVGPGRGSGPCSLVGFVLGITGIDPIKYGLPFERFVNPQRDVLPDFDLDFCDQRRDEVSSYIQSKYGAERVAQISSNDNTPLCSRLVICDRPLADLVTLYANPESGFPATTMNMAQIADAGLVQFNVINQRALTVIQQGVHELEKSGSPVDIDNIALDNNAAYRLLCEGEPSNIAELDNEHYKSTLLAVQPDRFDDLCAVIALCQPRSHGNIPVYIQRKRNPELIRYLHPALERITADTCGLILYQEQLMHIANEIAGFSLAEGDTFRRVLNKSSHQAILDYKKKFIDGATNFGLSLTEATGLCEQVAISVRSCFNKSHAVAYALIAYRTAWLKVSIPHQ